MHTKHSRSIHYEHEDSVQAAITINTSRLEPSIAHVQQANRRNYIAIGHGFVGKTKKILSVEMKRRAKKFAHRYRHKEQKNPRVVGSATKLNNDRAALRARIKIPGKFRRLATKWNPRRNERIQKEEKSNK